MKYDITYKCGHEKQVELFGKSKDRDSKIDWMKSQECPMCQAKKYAAANGLELVEMSYYDYKNHHSELDTVRDSYNAAAKTIIVYMPVETAEADTEEVKSEDTTTIDPFSVESGHNVPDDIKNQIAAMEKQISELDLTGKTAEQLKNLNTNVACLEVVKKKPRKWFNARPNKHLYELINEIHATETKQ